MSSLTGNRFWTQVNEMYRGPYSYYPNINMVFDNTGGMMFEFLKPDPCNIILTEAEKIQIVMKLNTITVRASFCILNGAKLGYDHDTWNIFLLSTDKNILRLRGGTNTKFLIKDRLANYDFNSVEFEKLRDYHADKLIKLLTMPYGK